MKDAHDEVITACRRASKRVAVGEPLREIALSYNVDHSTIGSRRGTSPRSEGGGCFSGRESFVRGSVSTPSVRDTPKTSRPN